MNRDRMEARWTQLKGRVREHWGRLTADDEKIVAGRREQLVGRYAALYAGERGGAAARSSRSR